MKRVAAFFLGFGMCILILEIVLRLLGFGYSTMHKVPLYFKEADRRIFCLGESTTWGIGAADPETENYPKQLENLFNQAFPDEKTKCFFDMTIGQNTSEILLKLPTYIEKYQPDIVVMMVGINNWWNLDKSNILLFNDRGTIFNNTLRFLIFMDRFRVWKLIKWIRLSLHMYKERWDFFFPSDMPPAELYGELLNRYGQEIHGMLDKLAEHDITEMMKICTANNINVILCTYPRNPRPSGHLHWVIRQIARKHGLTLVDNDLLFAKLPNMFEYLSPDGLHPNSKGYAFVAKNVFEGIQESEK
jgi:lysophospholipase L1-like esterase